MGLCDSWCNQTQWLSDYCSTDNRAITVFSQFLKATCLYGLPWCENLLVALFVHLVQGLQHRSFITGESVHNQRIECLWRDVFLRVLQHFYLTFYALEDSEVLNPDNDVHRFSLHIVYLPEIQNRLEHCRQAWNHHVLRTENNHTPTQLWDRGHVHKHCNRQHSCQRCVWGTPLQRPKRWYHPSSAWNSNTAHPHLTKSSRL